MARRTEPLHPSFTATEAAATYQALAYLAIIFRTADKPLPNAEALAVVQSKLANELEGRGFELVEGAWRPGG